MKPRKSSWQSFTSYNPFLKVGFALVVIGLAAGLLAVHVPGQSGTILLIIAIAVATIGAFLLGGML